MVAERRVGVLGGTCNPVHLGHLIIAEEARTVLGLERVLFVPAGQPWMKEQSDLAAKEDRWEMVLRATGPDRYFEASRIDLDRDGPSYAVDTLRELRAGCQVAPEYFFILGLDALAGLASWKEPEALLGMCRLAVAARPGLDKVAALNPSAEALPGLAGRADFLDQVHVDISASDIRQRCREGRSIRYRVPQPVEDYIRERGLYR